MGSIGLGTIKGEVGAVKTKDGKAKRDADAMPTGVAVPEKRDLEAREPFVILPPGNPGVQEENRLVKRQRRKGSSGGNGNGTEEEEEENAATTTRMGMTLGAPALALLVAVLGAVIM